VRGSSTITAPPSSAHKIVDVPELHRDVILRYGIAGNILWIESAGAIGTHMKIFGWLPGCTEFYDEHGEFVETADVWWYIDHYETFCREHSIAINGQLYL
jgi:hypothetical protein